MSRLRSTDLSLIDLIFRGDGPGYILDFSNRTFAEFFARDLGINIDADQYAKDGTSKGKRLRCFLAQVDDTTAARTLRALRSYREMSGRTLSADIEARFAGELAALIAKLEDSDARTQINVVSAPTVDIIDFFQLSKRLTEIRGLPAQERGYAFEKFLVDLFDTFRLKARQPFRLKGEQIDGSFELAGDIYLVEAKWLNTKIGVADLHVFHGKIEQKAAWTRGAFISFAGFTDEGLTSFGRNKRIIGVSGQDIKEALDEGVAIDQMLEKKVRLAAETGEVFIPFSKLGMKKKSFI